MNNITQQYWVKSNTELWQLYKKLDIRVVMLYRKIEWAEHVWRSNGIMKIVLNWKPNNIRPKQKWIDKIKNNLMKIGTYDEETWAQNRDG